MANSGPLVLDISSDDEAGFGDGRSGGGCGIGGGGFIEDECFWLTKLLEEATSGSKEDDSDDVVLVSEVFLKSPKKSRLESQKASAVVVGDKSNVDVDDDDDDCLILDGDPDDQVVAVNGTAVGDDGEEDKGNDSDDLEIVGEKGEVACRDFPHARHLCVKYVFASTPHEVHCSQCHCYVCDSLAPCSDWGTGVSSVDHCHANDKEEYWRVERARVKEGSNHMQVISAPIVPTTSDNSLLEAIIPTTQVLAPPLHDPLPQIGANCPVTIRPCSSSSNVAITATISQGHPYEHAPTYGPRSDFVSLPLHPAHCNSTTLRDRGNNAGSRSVKSLPTPGVLRRPGFVGSSPNNRRALGSALHYMRYNPYGPAIRNGRPGPYPQNVGRHPATVLPPTRMPYVPAVAVGHAGYLPSEPQARLNNLSIDPLHGQSQMLSPHYVNSNFRSAFHMQPRLPSQSNSENFGGIIGSQSHVSFQPDSNLQPQNKFASHVLDAGSAYGDQLHSRCNVSSYPRAGNNFESQSYSQAHDSSTTLLVDDQTDFQQGNYTHNSFDAKSTDIGINWNSTISHDNQQIDLEASQCQNPTPGDNSLLQYLTEEDDHRSRPATENFHPSAAALADCSSQLNGTDCQFPESTNSDLNFNLDNWMFGNDSFPGALDVPISPGWNVFSSCPSYIDRDTGTEFDI